MRILSLRVRDKTESEVPCHSQSKEQIDAEPELTTKSVLANHRLI